MRNEVVGPAGHTTATRMDKFTEMMLAETGLISMVGKAERGPVAIEAIKKSDVISYLTLRGSVSQSGNVNLGAYSLEPTYGVAGGFPYGSLPGFTASSSVNNPTIKPEFVLSKEVGFELSLFRNRFSIEATA